MQSDAEFERLRQEAQGLTTNEPGAVPGLDDDSFERLRNDARQYGDTSLRTTLSGALAVKPDTYAEQRRIAARQGVEPAVVETLPDEMAKRDTVRQIEQSTVNAPTLRRKYTESDFAKLGHDDSLTLADIEKGIIKGARYVFSADGAGKGLLSDAAGAAVDVGLGATAGVGEMLFNMAAVVDDAVGWTAGAQGARAAAKRSAEARQGFGLQPETATGRAVKSGLGSAGTNLALLPLGLERGLFATAEGAASATAGMMSAGVGADAYWQAREKGKGKLESAAFGIPQAAFEFVFEKIPAGKLFGDLATNASLMKTLRSQALSEGWTEQVTTLTQDFNEWMNLNPEKTIGQFLAERPDAAYETLIATLVGVGVQTSTLRGINNIVEKASGQQLTYKQDTFDELLKSAGASLLRGRSPEQFRAYVEQAVNSTEGAQKEVYVDGEALAQLPADILEQLPKGVQENIATAAASGGVVALPMADVLTIAPGTPLEQVLNDHARLTPDALTRVEAQQAQETLQQDAERVLAQAQDEVVARQEHEAVQADLQQQIAATGRYRPAVSEAYAAGLANFFTAYGSRTGLGTQGLYDAYRQRGFRISGAPTQQQQEGELESALPGTVSVEGYHFSPQARTSLSTAFYGTGLRGSARDEIMSHPDERLRRRLSFYFDKGTGVRPESGVGGIAHRAQLSNLYDADADLLGLRSGDARAFESALLDRGYSGYVNRMEGTQPGQAVLLGDQTIEPEVLGPRSSIAAGERLPALPREEAAWQTQDTGTDEQMQAKAERLRANPAWENYEIRVQDGALQFRPIEGAYEQSRVKDETPAVRKLLKSLTPIEQRKITDKTAAKIIEQMKSLPSAEEMAAVALGGQAKRGWYQQSAQAISDVFGPDAPRFAALLAATSPQCSVETNLLNALNIWKNWKAAGRPTEREAIIDVMGESVQGGRGRDSVLDAWINNSVRALTAENPADAATSRVFLSGPKVNSFFLNLIGVTDEVTNDAWMANYALVDQTLFSGSLNALGTDPGKGTGYLAMAARTREAAAILSKRTGDTWTPAEVQETVWSWAKTLYEMQVGDVTATRALEEGMLTDELINSTPDFSSLFNDPSYRAILTEAGYGDQLDTLGAGTQRAADGVADEGPDPRAEASEADRAAQRKHQLRAAKRLERLREQRAAGTLKQGGVSDVRPERTGDGSRRAPARSAAPLAGAPTVEGATGPDARLVAVAEQYAREAGIDLKRQAAYAEVDPERATRIASAYEAMKHDPQNPAVREAYADLQRQVLAQYLALQRAGYQFYFFDNTNDPYQGNPWNAMRDLRANQRMGVFATSAGFGTGATVNIGLADPSGGANLSPETVLASLEAAGVKIKSSAVHTSDTEPTLVAQLEVPMTPEVATQLSARLGQDAIAQRLDDGSGDLFGPKADEWGSFSNDYFLTIDGQKAASVTNPLLADTGLEWPTQDGQMKRVLANDLFRAVHDAFGHGLEGAGFRAQGEENAWQAHARLFTGPALGALTSETRGQNSWLNFGPHGEHNRTAPVEETIFADQKTGLMPEWTWTEGRVGDEGGVLNQIENNASGESAASLEAQSRIADEKRRGLVRVLVDRAGNVRPLFGVDSVDQRVRAGQTILQRGVGRDEWSVLDKADDVKPGEVERAKQAAATWREQQPTGSIPAGEATELNPDDFANFFQQARGTFSPKSLEIVLNENADLSTLWHEMGHFFLEVLTDIAGQPNAPTELSADYASFLNWAGVTDEQWRAMSLDDKRQIHERWAESIEQYIMEGKVPNKDLAPLMRRFSAWLKATYSSIKQFLARRGAEGSPMQLNDDIRRVMDRMLATDQQIAEANETAGLLPDETADAEAAERLRKRSMADLKWTVKARDKVIKDLQKQAKNERKRITEEVTAEVDALPVFAAKDAIAAAEKAHEADPFSADMNIAAIADAYGYKSVEAMYRAIDFAGEKADYIDGRVEQRMLEEHGDLMNEDAIKQAANEAVHNEARARSLASELRTQAEMLNPRQDTGEQNAKGQRVTVNALTLAAKQFGENVVRNTPIRDLKNKAWQHTAAERRAAKAWQQATMAGKTQEAVKFKQDQVLNHAAAKAALDAHREVEKALKFFARVTKGNSETVVEKGRDADIVNAARAALALYGVQTPATKNASAYLDAVKRNDPDTWQAIEPMVQAVAQNAQPLEALTFEELQGLHEQIEGMWYLAKRSRQMEVDGNLLDIQDAADELGRRMDVIGVPDKIPGEEGALTETERAVRGIRFFGAALKRVEQWSEGMDGKSGGPFKKYIFQPIKDAADRYRSDRVKFRRKFQNLIDKVAPSMRHELIEAPELGYTFGRGHNGIGSAELLHAMLHTGNDSNKRKLLLGGRPNNPWATEGPNGELDTSRWDAFVQRMVNEGKLTKEHFDFLQGVWDLLEETKPLAQQAHRDVYGRYFDEVTANAFIDPFGVPRRGGYVPAQADPELVTDNKIAKQVAIENESMLNTLPQPNRGFTKSRTEHNRSLVLDLRTIPQHIDKVLLFAHMAPPTKAATRLLDNKGVSQALNRIDPTIMQGTLTPWLQRSAKQMVETPILGDGRISKVASALRSRAGAAMMMGNLSNTVQQITGFSTAAVKVKPKYLLQAAAHTLAHPKVSREAVWSASDYMAQRADDEVSAMTDEMEKILLDPTIYTKAQNWTKRHAYFLQSAFDNVLSPIVWTAAYNQGVEEGMGEANAIRHADGVVRQTQGSNLPEDVSRIETGPAYARLFTQFVGYFNMIANTNATAIKQIAGEVGLKKGAGRLFYVAMMGLLIPTWVAEAIALAFRGGPGDDDKDGEYLDDWVAAVLGMGTIKGALAQVPFVGQLANASINRANSNPADDRMSISPAISLLEGAAGVPSDLYKLAKGEGNARTTVRDVASLVSLATGLPATAVARPLSYAAGVADDRIEPVNAVDAARGMLTGAAGPDTRR